MKVISDLLDVLMLTPGSVKKTFAITFFTALVFALIIIPIVIRVAHQKALLDIPDARKEHKSPIPTLGGIGIFLAFALSIWMWNSSASDSSLKCISLSLLILFFTGILDDLKDLRASLKFLIQIFAALIIAYGGIRIESLHGLLGIYELPLFMQYGVTILVTVGITNSLNLLDGIDGLAGGVSAINALVFSLLLLIIGSYGFALIAIALFGALLGFLYYNFNPAKIFMGDTGSLVIGFLLAVLGIQFLKVGNTFNFNPLILCYSILILPVFDTLRVFIVRLLKGSSPFKPDKNHIHHLLIKTGANHRKSALLMYGANITLIIEGIVLIHLGVAVLPSVIVLTCSAIFLSEFVSIKQILIHRFKLSILFKNKEQKENTNYLLTKLNSKR